MMVELPSDYFNEDETITDILNKSNKKTKLIFENYFITFNIKMVKANDDNYGSLCEEFLASFLLRYHVITHPCSEKYFNQKKI